VRADQETGSLIINQMLARLYLSDLVLADLTAFQADLTAFQADVHALRALPPGLRAAGTKGVVAKYARPKPGSRRGRL
jgi:hypothetical protein